jgi:hypothetical protein
MSMLYSDKRPQDATNLRDHVTAALKAALQEALKAPLHIKVNSSNIMHTDLQPDGDLFTINFSIEVHKKVEKDVPAPADVPA